MDRRARLTSIIRALSQRPPCFLLVVGNHCEVDPFSGERGDALQFMTDEGLEIAARYLIQKRGATNRSNERNRSLYAAPSRSLAAE